MANENELPLKLTLDDRDFVKRMRKATTFVKRNVTAIRDSVELIGIAWNAASAAVGGFARAVDGAVRASDRQDRLERRVVTALRQRATFTDENFKALQQFNAELDKRLGLGDEELLQLEGTLAAMGLLPGQIQAATKATIGLAQVTGGSMAETSRIVAKVFQGQVSALREYGIIVDSVDEAQEVLNAKFGIAATQGDDYTSQMSRLGNASGDAIQAIGKLADKFLGASDAAEDAANAARFFADVLADLAAGEYSPAKIAADAVDDLRQSYVDYLRDTAEFIVKGGIWAKHSEGLEAIADSATKAKEEVVKLLSIESFGGVGFQGSQYSPAVASLLNPPEGSRTNPRQAAPSSSRSQPRRQTGDGSSSMTFRLMNQRRLPGFEPEPQRQRGQFVDEGFADPGMAMAARLRQMKDEMLGNVGPQLVSGMGQLFGDLGAAMASGSAKAEQILGRFAGNMISMLGDMLIQFGTAALGLSPLSFIPGFQAVAGAPGQAAAAGAAAIAAGAALKLVGGAIGGSAGGGGGGGARGAPSRSAQASQMVGGGMPGFGRGTTVVNVSFGVVGDRRAAGRMIQGLINDARGLSLGGA